jgi:glycosyltransferase involved in cell wall biosynthesis
MACATPVVASDLGALRETGGAAAVFLPPDRVEAWVPEVVALLRQARAGTPEWEARRQASVARASRFSWAENARRTSELYDATLVEAAASGARYR